MGSCCSKQAIDQDSSISNPKQSINVNLIKPNLTLNKQIPDEKNQCIKFHTNIEVDMHGKLDDPYEWIIYVRQTLQSAYNKKVDKVTFIPCKGNRHRQWNNNKKTIFISTCYINHETLRILQLF